MWCCLYKQKKVSWKAAGFSSLSSGTASALGTCLPYEVLKSSPVFGSEPKCGQFMKAESYSSHFCLISRQPPLIKALLVFQWDHFMNLCGKESSAKWQGTSDDPFLQLVLIINPHEQSRNDCRSSLAWHSAQLSSLWYQTISCNVSIFRFLNRHAAVRDSIATCQI